ncbi:MAG: hypothetical protein HGA79_05620 [Anaerolineales bacterium]|nr:hypothetical protein [Anaerolineales bacterium]NTW12107.1 hypothetical protein [Anaerolineales bacterium]
MNIFLQRLSIALLVILLSLFGCTGFASALSAGEVQNSSGFFSEKPSLHNDKAPQLNLTNLTMDPLRPFALGDHPTISVHLTTEFGNPIPNQPIIIFVDGKRKASGQTDSSGMASIILKYKFIAGKYQIKALYVGVPVLGLPAASVETEMIIQPAKAVIRTIPPMAGIEFKFNDQIYTSDEDGFVNFQVNMSGSFPLEVLPFDDDLLPPNVTMEFSRWNDNIFTPDRQIYFPRTRPIEAGFVFKYSVDQVFFDSTGALVDPARISAMTIRGIGRTYTFEQAGPIWLPANRLTRRIGERLESQEILYYFREIRIDGANVINQSEQRFRIQPDAVWPINVLLYSAHFSARDAMFNFPIGRGIALTYPDGHTEEFLFDSPNAELEIPSLARGSYSVTIIGGWGSALATPMHLSQDQSIELPMISYLDMAVLTGVPLLFALLLLFIGRPRILLAIRHPSRFRELLHNNTQRSASLKSTDGL